MNDPYPYSHAPAPSRHPTAPAALRRPHAGAPPNLLITTLDNAHNSSLGVGTPGQTPVSSTSLSSPFSAHPQSAYPHAQNEVMRAAMSQSLRPQAQFSGTYNPQQWGPMTGASPQTANVVRRHQHGALLGPQPVGPDEPVASPPPPYSPRRDGESHESPHSTANLTSPAESASTGTDSSRHVTPTNTTATISPNSYSQQASTRGLHLQTDNPQSASPSMTSNPAFPPPPPSAGASKSGARGISKGHGSGLLASLRGKASNANASNAPVQYPFEDLGQSPLETHQFRGADLNLHPPGSRRAASTGAIGTGGNSLRSPILTENPASGADKSQVPPPPPGPPPSALRSQSLNRYTDSPASSSNPRPPLGYRAPLFKGTALDTVPPTPADWREESPHNPADRAKQRGPSPLRIDTGSIIRRKQPDQEEPLTVTGIAPSHARRDSSTSGLFRSPAVRNRSAKGIRERRSDSRNGKNRATENHNSGILNDWTPEDEGEASAKPSDLDLVAGHTSPGKNNGSGSSRADGSQIRSLKGTINSADRQTFSTKGGLHSTSRIASQPLSARSLDGVAKSFLGASGDFDERDVQVRDGLNPQNIQNLSASRSSKKPEKHKQLRVSTASEARPISHILHIPVADDGVQVPLTPSKKASERPVSDLLGPESPNAFAARANERHRAFSGREASAKSDSERLDIFISYILAESRIRREQYADVFDNEEVQIEELVQGLFRLPRGPKISMQKQQEMVHEEDSRRTSLSSNALGEESSSQAESYSTSQKHESPSSATTASSTNRPGSGWIKDYVPCLSPIASMSIATGQDDAESRGRAPSRWWEGSNSGDTGPSDGFKVLARSKRESKYMGVSKEHLDSPAFQDQRISTPTNMLQGRQNQNVGPSSYAPDEYPPEKVGWYEGSDSENTLPPPPPNPPTPASAPYTPSARQLDVSRLVTLPPPYPRHHPAVNNSHPDLAEVRAVVRSLQDKSEPESIRESYRGQIQAKRQRASSWQNHQRSLHQQEMQFRLSQGDISSPEYEDAEAALEEKIHSSEKEFVQTDFDLYQNAVVSPLHAVHTERVNLATKHLDRLSSRVFSDAQSHSPNLPQEEGDERPELLEMLTMLKWLFDARENCHRQLFDLLSERNEKYKSVVVLPYTHQGLQPKIEDALAFFAQDMVARRKAFDDNVLDRAKAFLHVIESNVSRGVEMQLDAFWSIAPQLKELLHKVPTTEMPSEFEVQIPAEEYEDNPSYEDHPLQYLYSLLSHAEKSTYQFIESQVNLFCLLHEIRNAVLIARLRTERSKQEAKSRSQRQPDEQRRWEDWQRSEQAREEADMTVDLKDKVGVVEMQWTEALGEELMVVRERVRGWLLEEDGWDDEQAAGV